MSEKTYIYEKKIGLDNEGSTIIEVCMIMPIVVFVCVMAIMLFFDTINDAMVQNNSYSALYTYDEEKNGGEVITSLIDDIKETSVGKVQIDMSFNKNKKSIDVDVKQSDIKSGSYTYSTRNIDYETEFDICTKRLRGWQFYGDTFCE